MGYIARHTLVVMALLLGSCYPVDTTMVSDQNINYDYVKASLGDDPGFGMETKGTEPVYQPMAYGLVAWAGANRADVEYARFAADWLVRNSLADKPGWGLGWEWDAFSNGTLNPADTVYGITTAIAVDGLVRTYLMTKDDTYLQAAQRALNYYMQFQCPESGHIHYSDQSADSVYQVPNITAMLMGQYARLGDMLDHEPYTEVASRAYEAMKNSALLSGDTARWKYAHGLESERNNDLVHACYIVYGLYLYETHTKDHHDALVPIAARYLEGFVEDEIYEFSREGRSAGLGAQKARIWGVGMLLYIAAILNEDELIREIAAIVPQYEYAPKRFSYRRGDVLHCPRAVAHLLLGFSVTKESIQ